MYYKGGEENDMTIVNSLNDADQTQVGNRLPTYTGGLGTRVNWGGFYADANFLLLRRKQNIRKMELVFTSNWT